MLFTVREGDGKGSNEEEGNQFLSRSCLALIWDGGGCEEKVGVVVAEGEEKWGQSKGNLCRCVGGGSGGKSEKGWGGWQKHGGTVTGLSGSRDSPQGALADAGSQKQGLIVQDTGLVLALMLHKA